MLNRIVLIYRLSSRFSNQNLSPKNGNVPLVRILLATYLLRIGSQSVSQWQSDCVWPSYE